MRIYCSFSWILRKNYFVRKHFGVHSNNTWHFFSFWTILQDLIWSLNHISETLLKRLSIFGILSLNFGTKRLFWTSIAKKTKGKTIWTTIQQFKVLVLMCERVYMCVCVCVCVSAWKGGREQREKGGKEYCHGIHSGVCGCLNESKLDNKECNDNSKICIRLISWQKLPNKPKQLNKNPSKIEEFFTNLINKPRKESYCFSDSIIIHIHGGGFIAMSSRSHQTYTRKWANQLKIPIFSIDYRLAPEFAYPAAIDDCWQAYNWILKNVYDLFGTINKLINLLIV